MPRSSRVRAANRWVQRVAEYWSTRIDECGMGCDWADAATYCWRCGCERTLQRCHIIPASLGGTAEFSNMVALCQECHEEAPDVADPEEMWRWIKRTSRPHYDTFWVLRASESLPEADWCELDGVPEDELRQVIKSLVQQTCRHFGRNGHSTATSRWVLLKVAEHFGCLRGGDA